MIPHRAGEPDQGSSRSRPSDGPGSQFRYWQGASGDDYLFTEVDPVELQDYPGTVVLLTVDGPADTAAVIFVGEARAIRRGPGDNAGFGEGIRAFVHFLASNRALRRCIIADLRAVQ